VPIQIELLMMKEITKVVGINLMVLLAYTVILMVATEVRREDLGFPILMMLLIGGHAIVCLLTAIVLFIMQKPNYGVAFIVAFLAVPLIGASFCFGGIALRSSTLS
jgi:hypothetical protein